MQYEYFPKAQLMKPRYLEVQGSGTQELEGDCVLYKDNSSEYFDAVEEIPVKTIEIYSDSISDKVSCIPIQNNGTIDSIDMSPSPADNAIISYSDVSSLTQYGSTSESIINSTEVSPTYNQSLVLLSQCYLLKEKDKEPYYCPDCGRGLGYSIDNFKHHIGTHKGLCNKNAGRPLYGCKICKQEFLQICSLEKHYENFGDSCRAKQISMNKEIYNFCAGVPQRVQSIKDTIPVSTRDNTVHLSNELVTKQDSNPYYCPDCGRGLGYSINDFEYHIKLHKGLCKKNAGKPLYGCKICKQEFLKIPTLKRHYKNFGHSCKTKQISMNRERYNSSAHVPQSIKDAIPVSTNDNTIDPTNELVTKQDSDPYYCPYCGKGLGYSSYAFRDHTGKFKGHCKEKFNGRVFYTCKYCTKEFITLSHLRTHNKLFGDTCKAKQISLNEKHAKFI